MILINNINNIVKKLIKYLLNTFHYKFKYHYKTCFYLLTNN